jgi:DNA-binding PadR family transcriptional regulator
MSETRDKRRRTDLDQFVLALIGSGVSTPYEFQKAAGLSQGATIPTLQRLLDARLVRQGKTGTRGRTDYQVTAAGKRLLKDGWLTLIEAGPIGDIDSDLRVALLALLGGGDRRLAADFLRQSADKKMEAAATAEPIGNRGALALLPRWYSDLRSSTSKALLVAESEALRTMADALPRKLSTRPRRTTRTAKRQKGL